MIVFIFNHSNELNLTRKSNKDIAESLLDNVMCNIHKEMSVGFASGLCGIVWGIDYLIHNNLVEGNSFEISEEIDKQVMTKDPRRIEDLSIETGFEGHLHYILSHLLVTSSCEESPFDDIYLYDIYTQSIKIKKLNANENLKVLIDLYIKFYEDKKNDYSINIATVISEAYNEDLFTLPPCLNGIAGYLIKNQL